MIQMTKGLLKTFLEDYSSIDDRKTLDNSRRDRFKKGWQRKNISDSTLEKTLTWENLGFRLKQLNPNATENEIEQILNWLDELQEKNNNNKNNDSRKSIPNELVPLAYNLSKNVFFEEITTKQALENLCANDQMNENTAKNYFSKFKYLMNGEMFNMTMNAYSVEYFIENIFKDFGIEKLENALIALEKHIDYYEKKSSSNSKTNREIFEKYQKIMLDFEPNDNLKEQNEILENLKLNKKTKEEILKELLNGVEKKDELIELNFTSYKRDNVAIAKIKYVRDSKCQLCGVSILKKNGDYYIEAAHIRPKKEKGKEMLSNILLLCPNHHKEFDLGNRVEILHTDSLYKFKINENEYEVKFETYP
jgi:5-methylcytosine-specific restriction enzyme A